MHNYENKKYKLSCITDVYNKFKNPDRTMFAQETLLNYLYVNTNMGTLENFDPSAASNLWMTKKKRRLKLDVNVETHQQPWFNGVFDAAKSDEKKQYKAIIKF